MSMYDIVPILVDNVNNKASNNTLSLYNVASKYL